MNYLFGENNYGARAGAVFSFNVCVYIAVSVIISLIISLSGLTGDGAVYLAYLASPLAIAITLAVSIKLFPMPLAFVAPIRCRPKYYAIALLSVFGLLFALSPLANLFVSLLKMLGYTPSASSLPSLNGWGMAGALFVIAVLPAVCEELLFRGAVLQNLGRGVGTVCSVVFSALVFAFYHGGIEQFIYQFACGCVFALIASRSGSVMPSALAHFLNNGVIIVLNGISLVGADGMVAMPLWAFILTTILACLALAAAVIVLISDKKTCATRRRGEISKFFAWGAVGMGAMLIIILSRFF